MYIYTYVQYKNLRNDSDRCKTANDFEALKPLFGVIALLLTGVVHCVAAGIAQNSTDVTLITAQR